MQIELSEEEVIIILTEWCKGRFGVSLMEGKDISISSKSYHALGVVVTIDDKPAKTGEKRS